MLGFILSLVVGLAASTVAASPRPRHASLAHARLLPATAHATLSFDHIQRSHRCEVLYGVGAAECQ